MTMKAYACPRCLALSSLCEDGDGGPHECIPTPLVKALEAERDHCLRVLHRIADSYSGTIDASDCQRIAAQGLEDYQDLDR